MPYKVIKRGNKWVVVNKQTGKVKGTHSSKQKAVSQMRLLYGIESGKWKPTGKQAAYKRLKKNLKKGGPEAYRLGLGGRKIRSKGKGRGLQYGKGKGPIGRIKRSI